MLPSQRTAQPRPVSAAARVLHFAGVAAASMVLLVLLAAGGFVLHLHRQLRASLAPLDGTLTLPELSAPVTVRRDAHGVPHIEAATLDDLLLAQGWVTASDRLWQMDMARRLPAGEAAEVLGSALVEHDRVERTLGMRDVAARLVRTLPPDQLRNMESYARGVNAYIAQAERRGTLPAEFSLLLYRPAPWQPYDSMLVALSMSEMLDERWQTKLKREEVAARLRRRGEQALLADLYPTGSWRDHPPVPSAPAISDPQEVPLIPLDPSQVRLPAAPNNMAALQTLERIGEGGPCDGCRPGSNEWAVSGAHTASGRPLLANDMHLDHGIPDLWYESELRAGGFHVAGVTVPGLPGIAAGHNDHIAWGFTALGGDTQDIYIEQLNARGEYKTAAGNWRPLEHERERIRVRGGADVALDVQRTAHGPLLTSILPGEKRALALHWTLYDDDVRGLPLFALDSAGDWAGFRAALAAWWAPTLNVVYADDAGHIGYQAVGLIPLRAGGLQAVPAAAGAGEWTGMVPFEQMPSVLDPEGGIVATANARVTPDGYPYPLTLDWASPYRNERIWHWLGGTPKLRCEDMLRLQTDVYAEVDQEIAQRFAYAVDHAAHPSARARQAADLLRTWDGVLAVNSPAAAVITAAEQRFWPAVLGAKIGDGWRLYDWSESTFAREQLIAHQPAVWLPPGYGSWNDFLAALVESALQDAPSDLHKWRYGTAHTIAIEHPLWKLLPGLRSGVGPLPQSGDASTVKQVSGGLGPSQRFTADLGDWDSSSENIVMGESGNPLSPFYRDQWPSWYGGSTFALPFSAPAVEAAAQHTLRLLPGR